MLTKALRGLKVTDPEQGRVSVLFATLKQIDHDNDVTLPGAFTDGEQVRISAFNHASWGPGALPVGKGQIREDGSDAVFDGEFFLNTAHGRETFETVKAMGGLQEWSYGYDVLDGEPGDWEGKSVNLLKRLKVHEISPVLLGAGIGTRTLLAKSYKPGQPVKCQQCAQSCEIVLGADGRIKSAVCPEHGKQLDSEIEDQLQDAGAARYGTGDAYTYLLDHDDANGFAIFRVCDGNGGDRILKVPYSNDAGAVVLGAGEQEVEQQTTFVAKGREPASAPESEPAAQPDAKSGNEPDTPEGGAQPASGVKLADHLASVRQRVDEVTKRLRDVVALRAEKGKSPADETVENASAIADGLEAAAKALREVVTSADADTPAETDGDEPRLTLEDETQLAETLARHGLSL